MDILVIGKPAINVYLPLQGFPEEGDIFTIKKKEETLGNIGATSACLLGKWGLKPHFTGVIGNDAYAEKIREVFQTDNVDSKFLEVSYEKGTCINYIILNSKNGALSKILYNDPEYQLSRFKYDFIPNYALIDGTDFAGAHAILNNVANCKTVFYGRIADKESVSISKRCSYTVCSEAFALGISHVGEVSSASDYVNMYQKIVDVAGNSNYVVILDSHKILYSVEGKVKMLPEMKINSVDYSSFDSVFTGAFMFAIVNNMEIDDAIKFANTSAAISISKLGEEPSIPSLDEVLDNSGLREKLGYAQKINEKPIEAQQVNPLQPENAVVNQRYNTEQNIDAFNQNVIPSKQSQEQAEMKMNIPPQPKMDSSQTQLGQTMSSPVSPAPVEMPNIASPTPQVKPVAPHITPVIPKSPTPIAPQTPNMSGTSMPVNNQSSVYQTPVSTINTTEKNIYDEQ